MNPIKLMAGGYFLFIIFVVSAIFFVCIVIAKRINRRNTEAMKTTPDDIDAKEQP